MRVVHIVTQMEAGGAQGAAVRMHKKMLNDGYDSKLIFLYKKRVVYEDVPGVSVILERKPRSILDLIFILKNLYSEIVKNRNSILLCYTHYSNVLGAVLGRLARVKRIVVTHRSLQDCYSGLVVFFDKLIGCLNFYDKVICVSNVVASEFGDYPARYKNNIVVIHNGVDSPVICSSGKYDWIVDGNYLNLVSAGRLHEQKNHQVLFKAVKENLSLRLIIAGDGHLRDTYQQYIEENDLQERLILIGEIPPSEVAEFISKGDVFVFPSSTEAFGFSLVEAMSIGMPVVTSDILAFKEIGNGELDAIKVSSEAAWADYFSNNKLRENLPGMSVTSRNLAKKYTFDSMYQAYLKIVFSE